MTNREMFVEYPDTITADDLQNMLHIGRNAVYTIPNENTIVSWYTQNKLWKNKTILKMKGNIIMKTFKETMTTVEKDLELFYSHLEECITEYIKSNADFADDKTVNHLTFFAFTYEYLNYIYSLLNASYSSLEKGREDYMEALKKFGITSVYMEYAYRYINIATIKFNALDDMCKLFEDAYNEADKYLKIGCKCGMNFQKEKLPERMPHLVIEALKKYERNWENEKQN